jgi:hypothetical protein
MADLGKLLFPRIPPRTEHTARAVYDVATGPAGFGAGLEGVGPTLDPVSDAVAQLAIVNAYFAVVSAGGNPTAGQYSAALNAMGALGADLRSLQMQPSPPPGSKVWVSGPAAVGVAGVSALVGGVVGWLAKGASKGGGSR